MSCDQNILIVSGFSVSVAGSPNRSFRGEFRGEMYPQSAAILRDVVDSYIPPQFEGIPQIICPSFVWNLSTVLPLLENSGYIFYR